MTTFTMPEPPPDTVTVRLGITWRARIPCSALTSAARDPADPDAFLAELGQSTSA